MSAAATAAPSAALGTRAGVLARLARRVLVAFPDALPGADWTGNPVREDIAAIAAPAQRYAGRQGRLRLLVVGGSLGAQALNEALPAALALLDADCRPVVVHQSGRGQAEALAARYRAAGVPAEVREFIDDMAGELAAADLVVCRAGAMTVAELAVAGVPAILVPYPHAVDDHQSGNARFLVDRGAGWLLPQAGHALDEHLYVVDPMGMWMMRMPPAAEPQRVMRDLRKLLRASSSWDDAGR
jgi:UDP-N-acetylglucosamine--N-acetylmuramyl-(pentapeptide) pyrophosphoryl-undecaprenol N-acetylglucosamine transferase